jgi:hypothetical protein
MLAGSILKVDLAGDSLLMGSSSYVASKRLRVLHIRLNLPES